MKYYFVIPNSIECFDSSTKYDDKYVAHDYGLQFSFFPLDDFLEFDGKYFCTERVFYNLFMRKSATIFLDGVHFVREIRTERNSNWLENYSNVLPENYVEVSIDGTPFYADLGIQTVEINHEIIGKYYAKYLILSARAVKNLILNHCPFLMGKEIEKSEVGKLIKLSGEIINNQDKYRLINNFGNIWE